jgi:CHAD domain-containing protein
MNILISEKPADPSVSLIVDALGKSWRTYLTELKRCRARFSIEAVHDLRVATRRVMALIQLLNSVSPRPRLQKLRRAFKDQLDEFDSLRDTQVILAEVSETILDLPQLYGFQKQQQSFEDKTLKALGKKIKKFQTAKITRRIRKVHDALEDNAPDDLGGRILEAVDDAFLLTHQRLSAVDAARPGTIHRVRVAFKSLRYMIEIIHPLLDGFPSEQIKQMNDYQSLMGEVQDAEVFMQMLNDYAENASLSDLEAVRRYYERRHAEAITAYVEKMYQLQSFWRAAPDQPFPWEKKT